MIHFLQTMLASVSRQMKRSMNNRYVCVLHKLFIQQNLCLVIDYYYLFDFDSNPLKTFVLWIKKCFGCQPLSLVL